MKVSVIQQYLTQTTTNIGNLEDQASSISFRGSHIVNIQEKSVWFIDVPPLPTASTSKTAANPPPTSTVPKRGRGRPPKAGLPLPASHGAAIDEVLESIEKVTVTRGRGTRQLSEMFVDLPDKEAWKEYYEVGLMF